MSDAALAVTGPGTFQRGIHPREAKEFSEDAAIEVLPPPSELRLPLQQHIGAPAREAVKLGQPVAANDLLAEAQGFVSSALHAPLTGKTAKLLNVTLPNGRHVPSIPLKADKEQSQGATLYEEILGGKWSYEEIEGREPEAIVQAIQGAGIVGMGGAAFPTHVKLTRNEKRPVDTLLVNGCECEPYLTADYRVMVEAPRAVVAGALLAARAAGAERVIIAVEDNKPQAIKRIRDEASGTAVAVASLKTKYPMGGERQTIPAVLGRIVPTGGLPLDVGVVVVNVGTAATIARAVLREKPCTHRVVTVTGRGVKKTKNLLVPIGAPISALLEACDGLHESAARVVSGGPMMGFTVANLHTPVTKGTSGITVLVRDDLRHARETACVRCGHCVDVCPLGLVPSRLALAARAEAWDVAARYHIQACMECGCCAFTCPASLPLVQLIRMAKARMARQ